MSVCPCARKQQFGSHWTDFHQIWFLKIFFSKISREYSLFITIWQKKGILHADLHTFMAISLWIILIMSNVSDRSCRENQNTHFVFCDFFFRKSCRLWHNVEKNMVQRGSPKMITTRRMRVACRINTTTNTHAEYVTLLFHCNNGFTNGPQCHVIRALPVLSLWMTHFYDTYVICF